MNYHQRYLDCGCEDENPSILSIPGTPGSVWLNGSGAPATNLGIIGDYYLNNTTGQYYQKTVSGWGSPIGTFTGANGSNGTNGTTVLAQVYPGTSTSGTGSAHLLNTIPVPSNTLKTNGSYLELETIFGFTDTNSVAL